MMRTVILLVFVCFTKINIAQVYQPFPTDSATWRQKTEQHFSPNVYLSDFEYSIQGDTAISGKTYHKIYRRGTYSTYVETMSMYFVLQFGPYLDNVGYVGAYREDSLKHIYFFKGPDGLGVSDSVERLLYDFNLNVGDTLPPTYNSSYTANVVQSIGSILLGTVYHKAYLIKDAATSFAPYFALIEGVGSTMGLLEELNPYFERFDNLDCFSKQGVTLYSNYNETTFNSSLIHGCPLPVPIGINEYSEETQMSIFPNPSTGIIGIKTDFSEKTNIEVFDVLGKRIYRSERSAFEFTIDLSTQPKGVYFLNAKSGNKTSRTQKIVLQ